MKTYLQNVLVKSQEGIKNSQEEKYEKRKLRKKFLKNGGRRDLDGGMTCILLDFLNFSSKFAQLRAAYCFSLKYRLFSNCACQFTFSA